MRRKTMCGGAVSERAPRLALVAILSITLLSQASMSSEAFFPEPISVTPLEDYVRVISGNLTANFINQWPRVMFEHSSSRLSPIFDFSLQTIFFYNESIDYGEGMPRIGDPIMVSPLHRLDWNFTVNELYYSSTKGQYFGAMLYASIDLFDPLILSKEAEGYKDPLIEDWGTISIQLEVSQLGTNNPTLHPSLTVRKSHTIDVVIDIAIEEDNVLYALSLEHNFQGGGSTHFARIYPSTLEGAVFVSEIDTWDNEMGDDADFSREVPDGSGDWQMMSLTTSSGAEQAMLSWNKTIEERRTNYSTDSFSKWLYRTTGTSVSFVPLVYLQNVTTGLRIVESLSLIDEGFTRTIRNLLLDSLPLLVGMLVLIPFIILTYRFARIRRSSRVTFTEEDVERTYPKEIKPR